jgi:hypothetical protein
MTTIEPSPAPAPRREPLPRDTLLPVRVQVVKFDIPFYQLVWLLIKLAIAAIPAAIIFSVLVGVVTALVAMLFGGMFAGFLNGWHWI